MFVAYDGAVRPPPRAPPAPSYRRDLGRAPCLLDAALPQARSTAWFAEGMPSTSAAARLIGSPASSTRAKARPISSKSTPAAGPGRPRPGRRPCEEMADLFAEDAVFEFPFQLPGASQEEQGRETFRAHLKTGAQILRFESVDNVAIHQTADPEVVIAEYRLQGLVAATGKRFTSQIVMVARVRDGLISWLRNYSNPLAV